MKKFNLVLISLLTPLFIGCATTPLQRYMTDGYKKDIQQGADATQVYMKLYQLAKNECNVQALRELPQEWYRQSGRQAPVSQAQAEIDARRCAITNRQQQVCRAFQQEYRASSPRMLGCTGAAPGSQASCAYEENNKAIVRNRALNNLITYKCEIPN